MRAVVYGFREVEEAASIFNYGSVEGCFPWFPEGYEGNLENLIKKVILKVYYFPQNLFILFKLPLIKSVVMLM